MSWQGQNGPPSWPPQPAPAQPQPQYGQPSYGVPGSSQFWQPQYGQPPYPQPVYFAPPPPVFVAPPKPPLPKPQKRAAAAAGMLGFTIISLGWTLFAIAASILLIVGLFAWLATAVASSDPDSAGDFVLIGHWFDRQTGGLLVPISIGVAVLGAAIWVGGFLLSRALLKRAGHPRPVAVTWSGLGLAVAGVTIANWILSFAFQVLATLPLAQLGEAADSSDSLDAFWTAMGGYGILLAVYALVSVGVTVLMGWLCWWWMAHVFRAPASIPQQLGPILPGLAPERGPWDPPHTSSTGY
ncbi:hypothetical protein [Schumannella sp. 10F1B-5-1]|uniref:hypothetical protein n=1 Tax=Schumannella sp. 10F1B-5-1 TaxID=2590780 RepID=UPI001C63D255|nr:hypothetical protein [Schumannella sp. 10F1B-5-1]